MSILEAFLAGKEARRQADAAEQVNRMQSFLAQNGQAIFQGDTNALGQLAGMGPQGLETAMSLRNANDQRAAAEAARARQGTLDQRQDQEWQWKVEQYAASKTAAEREAEAAKIEEGVKMAMMAQTPEQFDAIVTQGGMPEYAGMFDQREMLAARFMSVAEILKQNAPNPAALTEGAPAGKMWKDPNNRALGVVDIPGAAADGPEWRAATPEEAAQYGSSAGQINTKTGAFKAFNPPATMAMRTNADGTTEIIQGPNAKFTEAQSKDNVFATRARGALAKLEAPIDPKNPQAGIYADALANLKDSMADGLPVVGNYMTSDNFQVARTAGDEFLQAILRKDTGAAITEPEQALYGTTYLPQPGDSAPRLQYKAEARARAVAAIEAGMSQAQMEALARADAAILTQIGGDANAAVDAPVPAASQATVANPPQAAVDMLRQNDTPEYRKFFDETFGQGAAARVLGGN